jgi:hypothetical protein
MESRSSVNLNARERELMNSFSDRYRRVWLAYTRFNNVCITVFPFGEGNYQMYFAKNVQDWSLENLRNIVLSQTEK